MSLVLVNLGCGNTFHPEWCNFDLVSNSPDVIACDLLRGVPLQKGTCDAVYHSHVLEHLSAQHGHGFISECHRLLKSRGTIRVAVPDLEQITRKYLEALEKVIAGGDLFSYEWMAGL